MVIVAFAVSCGASPCPFTPALAAAPPDSVLLASINASIAGGVPIRVSGSFERIDGRGIRADERGLHYRDPFRFGVPRSSLPTSPIPWSEIEDIRVVRTALGRGAMIGLGAGLAAGLIWISADPPEDQFGFLRWGPTAAGVAMGRILLTTAAGTVLGATVGSSLRKWRSVFPAPVR